MKTNEKFNKFIEDAAKSADQINFIDMVKKTKKFNKNWNSRGLQTLR